MARTSYVIGLGSNRRGRHGSPVQEVRAALVALVETRGIAVAASPIIASAPLGPSIRRFANAVALIETEEEPPEVLARLKAIEAHFGRRRGQRWGARVIDLDIILWSGGSWAGSGLIVPHPHFRERGFVLGPLAMIVPAWRDPVTHRTVRQLLHAVDRRAPRP
jgi:2-amino-4-hydroxy-6-hydroxymethyldihydropteridine diphosphokinase